MKSVIDAIEADFVLLKDAKHAVLQQRYFKTGKGQYGEGDIFLGLNNPTIRRLVKTYAKKLSPQDCIAFVTSKFHDKRLFGLLCWVYQFEKGDETQRKLIYSLYCNHMEYVNNWDLVDLSAPRIVGPIASMEELRGWAVDSLIWRRRIAVLATFYHIGKRNAEPAIEIATMLLHDSHDLIHKAVGWMLREVGKRCNQSILRAFLDLHAQEMPRTMLRYAIEKLDKQQRQHYLSGSGRS